MAAISLSSVPATRRGAAAVVASFITASLLTYIFLTSHLRNEYRQFPFSVIPDAACDNLDGIGNDANIETAQHIIPNIVHYVWLLQDPSEFKLSFKIFVSVYSAHLFWNPDAIYIHTDAAPEVLDKARSSGDIWTRRTLDLPAITPKFVQAANVTEKGVKIVHMEHKADFLRITALHEYGGVYLDTDAVPLRDITPLRTAGFANVLGGSRTLNSKYSGYINNGVMLSVKQSTLMNIFYHAAHEFFDGTWDTASVRLLTDLANRMLAIPREVLVLEPRAFAPMSWEFEDQTRLFKPHSDGVETDQGATALIAGQQQGGASTCRDTLAWLRHRDTAAGSSAREMDFSSSYVLHAFDDSIRKIWGWDHAIDVKYVVARQSTYARAVFPAVWHAVQAGIISRSELV